MKTKGQRVTLVMLVVSAATALFLSRLTHELGEPGVRMGGFFEYEDLEKNVLSGWTNSVDLPISPPGFSSVSAPIAYEEISWLPPDTSYGRREYTFSDGKTPTRVLVTAILMGYDRTSIHKPQYCLPAGGFQIDEEKEVMLPLGNPGDGSVPMQRLVTTKTLPNGQVARGIYSYVFVSEDQVTASHGQRLWWMARDLAVEGRLKRWAYVSFFALCFPGDEAATEANLDQVIREVLPRTLRSDLLEQIQGEMVASIDG